VYGIVQQHGGFVHVESDPGRGTSVHVYLPRTMDAPEAPRAGTPPNAMSAVGAAMANGAHAPRTYAGKELVLVAEDEPSLRALVSTTLKELGYRVIAASDGEQAVREYEAHSRDVSLVVLDVVMPRLDAREAYERMRAIRGDVRVLFTTGYAPASTRLAQLLESGRFPVLEKPFTPIALAAKVRDAIDGG
jgi:two-component system cell cycle sensor histidine kinase/response regulator CckA